MNETERQTSQTEFEKLKEIVCENFQIEEALVEHNIPTFYLKQHQETKQAFLKLLEMLKPMNLVAYLRRHNEKIVLKIFPKPPAKPSNTLVNWLLLFATVGTTFAAGYFLSDARALPPHPMNGKPGYILVVMLHPVALAGWIGFFITMLNLLPAAMLDGGHITRSLFSDKVRGILTILSIVFLALVSWPMALFVLFMSTFKHPGPLDDVSSLSRGRKILFAVLVIIFVLSSVLYDLFYSLIALFRELFGV